VVQTSLATCDLAAVNGGDSVQLEFSMRSASAGTFSAHAQVVTPDDANGSNDTSVGSLVVQTGPPPQPTLPAVRQAIVELLARPPPRRCPHCRKWIRNVPRASADFSHH